MTCLRSGNLKLGGVGHFKSISKHCKTLYFWPPCICIVKNIPHHTNRISPGTLVTQNSLSVTDIYQWTDGGPWNCFTLLNTILLRIIPVSSYNVPGSPFCLQLPV